jgi:hypothetical protein
MDSVDEEFFGDAHSPIFERPNGEGLYRENLFGSSLAFRPLFFVR